MAATNEHRDTTAGAVGDEDAVTAGLAALSADVVPLPQALGERIDVRPTVESLRALILDSEADMERDGQMPQRLVDALEAIGYFHTIHPREFGGLELHPLDNNELIFELARINGSVAWIGIIQNGAMPLLAPEVMQELYDRADGRWVVAGSHGRIGTCVPVEGGYRFTGQWAFASGSPWSSYITAMAEVMDEDGTPYIDPYSGRPMRIDGIFPKRDVNYIGGWNSLGLRGTGSGEFSLDDVFVERRFTRQGGTHETYLDRALFRTGAGDATALVALGVAQGAIDRFVELAGRKRRKNSWGNRANGLGQEQMHQVKIAHADALIRAARSWIDTNAQRRYETAFSKDAAAQYEMSMETIQAGLYAARIAKQAINLVFDMAGTDSVIEGRGIERCFRDVHTATQHSLLLENRYAINGQYLLTRDLPDGPHFDGNTVMFPPPPRTGKAARQWRLDHLHSSVGFRVRHHAVGSFRGYFEEFSATYDADAGSITGSAQVGSVKVFEMLKDHLLGPEFLDAAAHPEVTFASTSVDIEGDSVTVQGDLTLKGVTKAVTATGAIVGPSRDRGSGPDSEFIGTDLEVTIDRRDFGIDFNNELLDGQMNLGWDVMLAFSLEFSRSEET